jgi:POT family proton-dependent oligopeptide transporter
MPFFTPANTLFICAVIPVIGYFLSLWIRARADEKGPMAALLSIFAVVIVFWMIFHQNGNTLTLWARDNTNREAGMFTPVLKFFFLDEVATDEYWQNVPAGQRPTGETSLVSTEIFQSINPFFVVVLTPVVVWLFAWLRRRKLEPSTPAKISWGLAITALSTLVMVAAVMWTHGGASKASGWWLVGTYGVITVGELFLSPMGLSLVSRLAPTRYTALMMGGWFLSTSIGNKLAGVIGGLWEEIPLVGIFWINFACALAAAGLIALMVPWIRRVMAAHETAGH